MRVACFWRAQSSGLIADRTEPAAPASVNQVNPHFLFRHSTQNAHCSGISRHILYGVDRRQDQRNCAPPANEKILKRFRSFDPCGLSSLSVGSIYLLFVFYLSEGAMTGSPISLLYSAISDGEQYISRISKPRGCNRKGNLLRASHGSVYILGSSIVTESSI